MQGVLLDERFRIGHRLGAGAMGQVWAAQDERMRRNVAVKVVHPQYGMDEAETQARFQREVQLAGRLAHQNIVTVHDWGEVSVDGRPTLFLVMELVQGVPLHRRLKESTPSWPLAVGWAAQIAEALHAAHAQDVVHRDIKPANALLTPNGTVKVLDFGVAKFMGETIGARELTVTGMPVGSPSYMSPEQADGDKAIDHRSDLYSLGCLLYHAVTGRPPFTGTSQWAVLRKQMQDAPEPPASRVEGLPVPLNDLILNLLAKRPDDRPADAAVVYEQLSTFLADHAVTEPGGSILDTTQLGNRHSVSGRLLKRAWELFQWTEWDRARQRAETEAVRSEAEQLLRRARTEAERLLDAASSQAQEALEYAERLAGEAAKVNADPLVEDARAEAEKILAEAREIGKTLRGEVAEEARRLSGEAEQLRADAVAEGEKIRAEARKGAVQQIEEAAKTAEELLSKAKADADELRQSATTDSENVRRDAIERATTLRRQAEETLERTRRAADEHRAEAIDEAERTVEEGKREVAVLERRRELLNGEVSRIQGFLELLEGPDERYYQVFKRQSIEGGLPTWDQFREQVKAVYGDTLSEDDAVPMVNRFASRVTAELEEDHIA
ncbi:protein kinase [Streptomyces sp. NPDC005303]|uniref:serine/threonine-protein kinase n=1 Tax=Streptomyces sp. NPDC005303 TaxID=3155713 RepID=UPI0033ACFA8F